MPDGLAEAAYAVVHGAFTVEQRKGVFEPELNVGDDASPKTGCWRTPVATRLSDGTGRPSGRLRR